MKTVQLTVSGLGAHLLPDLRWRNDAPQNLAHGVDGGAHGLSVNMHIVDYRDLRPKARWVQLCHPKTIVQFNSLDSVCNRSA